MYALMTSAITVEPQVKDESAEREEAEERIYGQRFDGPHGHRNGCISLNSLPASRHKEMARQAYRCWLWNIAQCT